MDRCRLVAALGIMFGVFVAGGAAWGGEEPNERIVKAGSSIQNAINKAEKGDTIVIEAGQYKGPLVLKDGVNLKGQDCNSVVIECEPNRAPVLTIDGCKDARVSELTLRHVGKTSSSGERMWPIVKVENGNARLEKLVILSAGAQGIRVGGKATAIISGCTVKGCGDDGIQIGVGAKAELASNRCDGNGGSGICFEGRSSGSVSGSRCMGNHRDGIHSEDAARPTITENECSDNKRCGVYISADGRGVFKANKVTGNGEMSFAEIQALLLAEKFDELEKLADAARTKKVRVWNGGWQSSIFFRAIGMGKDMAQQKQKEELIGRWIQKYPESVTAQNSLAEAYLSHAFLIRGKGYARTVDPNAWEPFREMLRKSQQVLLKADTLKTKDPALYRTWICVASAMDDMESLEKAFRKGIAVEPDYSTLYIEKGRSLLPRWHGKTGQYEECAREAVEMTKARQGEAMYFYMAREIIHLVDEEEYRTMGFDYRRIRQGQEDWAKQFPEVRDMDFQNQMCFMACMAGNRGDAAEYFKAMHGEWTSKVWGDYKTYERYCRWAMNEDGRAGM